MKEAGENRLVTEGVTLSGKRTAFGRHFGKGIFAADEAIFERKESFR